MEKLVCPTRVRIRRKNGEVSQGCDVYIGRRCTMGNWRLTDSIWANPFTVKEYGLDECLRLYWNHLASRQDLVNQLPTLAGKTIGCFCELENKCHGDILIHAGRYLNIW